jgi:ArsR family transcriptional regulator
MKAKRIDLDQDNRTLFEERARVLKALAHPTRLFLLERLGEREHCVCQLTDMVGSDMSTVSKHLSVMRSAGIVAMEKRGQQVWYRLKTACVLNFLTCIESVLREDAAGKLRVIGK